MSSLFFLITVTAKVMFALLMAARLGFYLIAGDCCGKGSYRVTTVARETIAYTDTYLENLKGELCYVEDENAKLSNEVGTLTKASLEEEQIINQNMKEQMVIASLRISLSLRTYLPEIHMAEQNHELVIKLMDDSMELKHAEVSLFVY
ncbi:hypothetical protein E3N88_44587 [Mikania micrantha]|uniref:Uncharacterized protein n=1 Tax=Mikania micrantha TaxID=192012 RepID=A0A5N6LBW0_9ASTR|nr:hypothetical protein E3N88_44587 [Mikania micrantha]